MPNVLFSLLHVAAVIFGAWALVITIPLHLIYAALSRPSAAPPDAANPDTHVRCPDCRELVLIEARKCKHCGATLDPQALAARLATEARADSEKASQRRMRLAATAAFVVAAWLIYARLTE